MCVTQSRRDHESQTPELSFGHNFYPFDRFVLILGYVVGGSKTKRLMCAVLRAYHWPTTQSHCSVEFIHSPSLGPRHYPLFVGEQ